MKSTEEIVQQKTDIREIVFKILRYKYYFVVSAFIALGIAYFFNKYSSPKYYNRAMLLIKEDGKKSFMSSDELMQGFGLFAGITNVENELSIINSYSVVNEAVQELQLEATYMSEEKLFPIESIPFKAYTELYKNSPIQVILDQTHVQPVDLRFYVDIITDSTFKLRAFGENVSLYYYINNTTAGRIDSLRVNKVYKFGEKILNEYFSFSVHLKDFYVHKKNSQIKYYFTLNNLNWLAGYYKGSVGVSTTSATSSIVNVTLTGGHPEKITDFLNTLCKVYLDRNLEKKNRIAFNTVKFIDSRISDIADSLSFAENKLQNFRSSNQVMNISFQGQKLYEKINSLENERAVIFVKQKYYDYIKEYFESNNDVSDLVAPSSMEVQDPVLNEMIGNLLELNSQRMKYLQQNQPKNLFLRDLEIQISNLKKTIIENIEYNSNTLKIALEDIESRMAKLNTQITSLPRTERELIGMERQFKLNDAIYTFLLQKRAEAQIAQASNTSDYEILDAAEYFRATQVAPKKMLNFVIAIFFGLFIPFVIVIARDFLNNKISDIKDVESISRIPIIGQVLHNKFKSNTIIQDYPKSPLADSFRAIRTNLQFFAKGREKMVILITSSLSGEGKSFISMNLASVYALLGKKTVLVGFDLRRPALFRDFKLKNDVGVTSFLINSKKLDDIIQETNIKNLDLIAAGPIPPNPVELMASEKTNEFLELLRQKYDYIIIDSSPIGAVTDSFLLFEHADLNVFVIRQGVTIKESVKTNLKNIELKEINNVSLLLNDIKLKKNSYSYAYQSRYYEPNNNKGLFRRLFSRKKNK